MRTQLDLDEFIPTMDTPEKVYQLFDSLGYKVLDSRLKTNPSVYNLPVKEAALVEKIFAVSNYDRRFQVLLFKLKEENKEAIRTIPEKILREVDFPFIIFTPDFKTYTFTLVEKVREGPGEFKRKLTKLVVDSSQPYHTDKEILGSLALSTDIKNPVEVYRLFQSAFNVERVTKKFFTEYREVFEKLSKEITKQNKHLKFTLFSREGSVENFTKILLGRLMFLYFIQKRGWLNCFDGWGSGDKKFLYNKFQEAKKDKKNYFKDYLEPLFFDTLNNPRRDKPDQATMFGGRIPFLNGGLFEPEYDYADVRNHILLENSTFDDVFSVFEKYNFTVKEDEPLEKEVAIDPEMLGKVFENLLEENLRKGKGTYYTPREIVYYMCHESLINYLASEVNLDQDVVRNFLDREQSLEKKETLSSAIREKAKEIDEKLADIKVLDPACGSGAFLVGMLHEVINARLSLNRELGRSLSEYELKKATIQNNIYGVDIDPGASEIAKLRLWLTLVVDHNLSEIEPLPNLDYKIMVGNSLLDEFMGVKLFNLEKAKGQTNGKKALKLFEDDIQQVELFEDDNKSGVLKALQKLHALYFKESDPEKKKQIRTQIDKIEFDLIEATVKDEVSKLESQTKQIADKFLYAGVGIPASEAERISKLSSQQSQILETFNEIKKSNVKPFFLFQLHFSDVFEKKGGFDVVIANPPYLSAKNIDELLKPIYEKLYKTPVAHYDIYVIFFEEGLNLLKPEGVLTFITSNKYFSQKYGDILRKVLLENTLLKIINFNFKVFDATVDTAITIVKKQKPTVGHLMDILDLKENDSENYARKNELSIMFNKNAFREIKQDFFNNLPEPYFRLDVKEKDVAIFNKISFQTLPLSSLCYVIYGLVIHNADKKVQKAEFIFEERRNNFKLFTEGKYIDRWHVRKYKFLNYSPQIHREPRYPELFENHKLIGKRIIGRKGFSFLFDDKNTYVDNTIHIIIPYNVLPRNKYRQLNNVLNDESIKLSQDFNLKYILALINSTLFKWIFQKFFSFGIDVYPVHLKSLPIKNADTSAQTQFVSIVEKIISSLDSESSQNQEITKLEEEIDQMVYKLYGLTPEEIDIVERNTK